MEDTGSANTTYIDRNVEAGTRYVYRVKARNGDALSDRSNYFDANLPQPPVPAKPTGLTGDVAHDRVALSWDDPHDDTITGYEVLRRDRAEHAIGEFLVHVEDTGSADITYTDTDVEAGAEYVYRVKARNVSGLSEQSSYFNANLPQLPAVTVSFDEGSYSVSEGQSVEVVVALDEDPEREVVIEIVAANQSGASDADYTVATDSVTFSDGQTRKSFTVAATDDTEDDDGESVTLHFAADLPYRVSAGSVTETTISITDNDELAQNSPDEDVDGGTEFPGAPTGLTGTATRWGVSLTWDDPDDDSVTGYQILRHDMSVHETDEFAVHVDNTSSSDTSYRDCEVQQEGHYVYRVKTRNEAGISPKSGSFEVTIPEKTTTTVVEGGVDVEVEAVPIVVESTPADYFVLYVKHDVDGTEMELPVLVQRGESGTTTLSENVAALPKERYRVEKHSVQNPSDIDGDCTDDITELDSPTMTPLSVGDAITTTDGRVGAVNLPDHAAFRDYSVARALNNDRYLKVSILDMDTDRPRVYFQNIKKYATHYTFLSQYFDETEVNRAGLVEIDFVYRPGITTPNGSSGAYIFKMGRIVHPFSTFERAYALFAARMPMLNDNLFYWIPNQRIPIHRAELERYRASRINLLFDEDIFAEIDYDALNNAVGYGLLTERDADDQPHPREVVIYEALPNELPRVAGIISTVPQTPLSHVNLRAVQNGIPNAFIRDGLDDSDITDLIGRYVRYAVSDGGYTIRAASKAEVDAHYALFRPSETQTPERDLSVTEITELSEIDFDDWDAFGVKAANVALLGSLDFAEGTVPDGYAIPFYFYDRFMRETAVGEETVLGKKSASDEDKITLSADTKLIDAVETMLAHTKFQEDFEIQEEMLDDLRDAIEDADAPEWIIEAIRKMNEGFEEGTNRRYRSSTNNEDLPGFNGAGLYDSKSQKPSEDEKDLAKSLKEVYASLWNFRAFTEREFHRIDHMAAAMGILVHPSYQDELVNGVAVSFDPIRGGEGHYYVNSQVGEDLVTNPEAHSEPEQILLKRNGEYSVLATSGLVDPGQLLMSDEQMKLLRRYLEVIHKKFEELYEPASDTPFAMEIEFKITSDDKLAIKQARPWVFGPSLTWAEPAVVSNMEQPSRSRSHSIYVGRSLATDFTTSDESQNWLLNGVTLDIQDWATNWTPVVALHGAGNDGPGELITTMTNPPIGAGIRYFKAPANTYLTAGDTYWIVVSSDANARYNFTVWTTRSNDEDESSATGWRIGDNSRETSGDNQEWGKPHFQSLKMEIEFSGISRHNLLATGAPTISGTALVGETLTSDATGIADADGLTDTNFTYQWIRNDTDISAATSSTYTLVDDDENATIKVRVSFTDDAGHAEELVSEATAAVAARPNSVATGTPTISGTAEVGQVLTADTSGISDADGLTNVTYGFQWMRNGSALDENIPSATDSTHTLREDDEGKTIKVRVNFTDDRGNAETLTSAPTAIVVSKSSGPVGLHILDSPVGENEAVLYRSTTTLTPVYHVGNTHDSREDRRASFKIIAASTIVLPALDRRVIGELRASISATDLTIPLTSVNGLRVGESIEIGADGGELMRVSGIDATEQTIRVSERYRRTVNLSSRRGPGLQRPWSITTEGLGLNDFLDTWWRVV